MEDILDLSSISEDIPDDTTFVLTEATITQRVLSDFGINVNLTVAKYIFEELMNKMCEAGYVAKGAKGMEE